ncbi:MULTISPECIES: DinB family protein [Arenibacter]|uniref:DinB family protein n=1 Tax=Arenibacter TaxID=178469 RepID=UPI001C07B2D5|nr:MULTISPECIES: DinB family protein [Arenibacter]MBU2904037.1 DinB family protein [Arenibacter algicola]MCK0135928.1 DinB family protein [Arenibacter sp. S6351L]
MFNSSFQTLESFKEVLTQLPEAIYTKPCPILSNATIGQHTRHIIELYQCLVQGYGTGSVSYDRRQRDKRIETDVHFATFQLVQIQISLEKPNKKLNISFDLNGHEQELESNYFREVMYNLEHTIHHEALIKVGINLLTDIKLPDSFGVAPSTLKYRKQCAQ